MQCTLYGSMSIGNFYEIFNYKVKIKRRFEGHNLSIKEKKET